MNEQLAENKSIGYFCESKFWQWKSEHQAKLTPEDMKNKLRTHVYPEQAYNSFQFSLQ